MTSNRRRAKSLDATGALDRAKALDWVATLGPTIADLIGGRVAIALRGLLRLHSEYMRTQRGTLEGSSDIARTDPPDFTMEDELAVEFLLTLRDVRPDSGPDAEFADYVRDLAISVWANGTAYRELLASLVWEPDDIRILCRDAGLDMSRLVLQGNAERQWFSIFEFLRTQPEAQLLFLLFLASRRHPADGRLRPWQ